MRAKLKEIKEKLGRMHDPLPEVGQWLQTVVRGWYGYFAVLYAYPALLAFRRRVAELWLRVLKIRSASPPWEAPARHRQCTAGIT